MWGLLKLKVRLMKDYMVLYLIMIGMSLFMAGIFGNTMGGNYVATLALVDLDQSIESSEIITNLTSEHGFNVKLMSYDEALIEVENRNVISAVVINNDFNQSEKGIEIVQIRETVESFQLARILQSEVEQLNNIVSLSDRILEVSDANDVSIEPNALRSSVRSTYLDHWESKKPISLIRSVHNASSGLSAGMGVHYTVGMTLFFVTYSIMFTVGDILEDKRIHTLDRLLVSPATRRNMLTANLFTGMLIGVIQLVVMVLSGQFLFGISWGEHIGLVLGIGTLYIGVMTTMSLFIVSLVKTMAQLGSLSPIILTGMGMLGGCMWPLEIITSKTLLMLANITPHKWALSAIEGAVIYGRIDQNTWLSVGVLAIMGIGYLILGERMLYFKSLKQN